MNVRMKLFCQCSPLTALEYTPRPLIVSESDYYTYYRTLPLLQISYHVSQRSCGPLNSLPGLSGQANPRGYWCIGCYRTTDSTAAQ